MTGSPMNTEKRSEFMSANPLCAEALWSLKRAKAAFVIKTANEETIQGPNLDLSPEEAVEMEDLAFAAAKEPYGNVPYGDPGYQPDKKKRYPLDTESHLRSAWSYINQAKNAAEYTPAQVAKIKARIISRWKKVIDPKGPPSAA